MVSEKKKVCLLGSFSVGKTSLVDRYVHSIFSDRYLSTVGVKISKKDVNVDGKDVTLVLWDMEGKDMYATLKEPHLKGAMGYFVVVDGTRKETLRQGFEIFHSVQHVVGDVPCFFLLNKCDLEGDGFEVTEEMLEPLRQSGIECIRTSAKDGTGVEEAFERLTRAMLLRGERA